MMRITSCLYCDLSNVEMQVQSCPIDSTSPKNRDHRSSVVMTTNISSSLAPYGLVGLLSGFFSQFALLTACHHYNSAGLFRHPATLWFIGTLAFLYSGLLVARTVLRTAAVYASEVHLELTQHYPLPEKEQRKEEGAMVETVYGSLALAGITVAWICMGGGMMQNLTLLTVGECCISLVASLEPSVILSSKQKSISDHELFADPFCV